MQFSVRSAKETIMLFRDVVEVPMVAKETAAERCGAGVVDARNRAFSRVHLLGALSFQSVSTRA